MKPQRDVVLQLTVLGVLGMGAILAPPASAQVSDAQVGKVVEALRQASKPEKPTNGLYSDWQVKPENVSRWAKQCNSREVSLNEFQNNLATARSIVTCVVRDVFKQEYRNSNNNEAVAVQRVAAWWRTGNAAQYNAATVAPFAQKVLTSYQGASASQPTTSGESGKGSFYDRYMQAAYAASQKKDKQTALIYFRRALDERPQDQFALQAIRNLEAPPNRAGSNTPR